jgi:hypothetical protein
VGGVSLLLEGLAEAQREKLARRYGVFASPRSEQGRHDLVVRISVARRPGFLLAGSTASTPEYYRIVTSWHGGMLLATSYEWSGWMDSDAREGGLALADIALADSFSFDRSIENYLRVVFAHLVVRRGGFLLHSAGLVRDGHAWLFLGPSGSGKTTVTSLSPDALILSDDLTLVARDGDGVFRSSSVPFRGVFAPEYSTVESFPVAGFFRLVQSPDDRLERLEGARAVGDLVGSLPFVTERREMLGEVLDLITTACRSIPVFRLYFTRSRNFWNVLSRAGLGLVVDDFSANRGIKA